LPSKSPNSPRKDSIIVKCISFRKLGIRHYLIANALVALMQENIYFNCLSISSLPLQFSRRTSSYHCWIQCFLSLGPSGTGYLRRHLRVPWRNLLFLPFPPYDSPYEFHLFLYDFAL